MPPPHAQFAPGLAENSWPQPGACAPGTTCEPPPLYDGDAARWPVHAAASADDLTRLQALLGPADDFDPDRKQDGLELVPVRKEREGRIALVEQRDDSGRT